MRNITFTADEQLIDAAREQAAADNTTLNEQFRQWLAQYARKRQLSRAGTTLARLQGKYSSGGRRFTRDEMNERR